MRAELNAVHQERKQLQDKVLGLEAQGEQLQSKGLVTKPPTKPSLMERRALSQLSLTGGSAEAAPAPMLPGAVFKQPSADGCSDASTAAASDSPLRSSDSDTGPSESLPIRAWSPDESSSKPKRRNSRSITEASPFAMPFSGGESADMELTIQMRQGSFKNLRFAFDSKGDAPVQPSVEIGPHTSAQATLASVPSECEASQRRSRRSCTESWGGDRSAAEAVGLLSRRDLLDKVGMNLPRLGAVEKASATLDPKSPKRHRCRSRTRPGTWDAQDLESVRKSANAFEQGQA